MSPAQLRALFEAAYDQRNARVIAHFHRHCFSPLLVAWAGVTLGEVSIGDADILAASIDIAA